MLKIKCCQKSVVNRQRKTAQNRSFKPFLRGGEGGIRRNDGIF